MSVFCPERLHSRRKELGLSLDQLAKSIGSSKSYIWELENRRDRTPSVDKVYELAKFLGVKMEWLCGKDVEFDDYAARIGVLAMNAVLPRLDLDLVADAVIRNRERELARKALSPVTGLKQEEKL